MSRTVLSVLNDIAKHWLFEILCIPQPFIYSWGERISLKLTTRLGMIAEVVESITTADSIILNHLETPTQSGSRSPSWNGSARMNPATTELLNIFFINCKHVLEWCQKYSLLKDQTCGALRKHCHICCGKPCTNESLNKWLDDSRRVPTLASSYQSQRCLLLVDSYKPHQTEDSIKMWRISVIPMWSSFQGGTLHSTANG